MKIISIIQPWATLIAIGEKKFETRSWVTRHRGELAIHASKKIDKETCRQEPFRSVLARHGYTESNLPVGMILATGQLADCLKVEFDEGNLAVLDAGQVILGNEYDFGDYTEEDTHGSCFTYGHWISPSRQRGNLIYGSIHLKKW